MELLSLPNEIILQILENLEYRDILNFSETCVRCNLLSHSTKNVEVDEFAPSEDPLIFDSILCWKYSFLMNIDLSNTEIEDVSNLSWVHTLNISNTGVKDVSTLGNLHTLNASRTSVLNVHNLGNLHTLDISYTSVFDASMLGNLHTLDISFTLVKYTSALKNIKHLYMDSGTLTYN
jgi:hypothetical protein